MQNLKLLGSRILKTDLDVDFDDHTEKWINDALIAMKPLISVDKGIKFPLLIF